MEKPDIRFFEKLISGLHISNKAIKTNLSISCG
jgi:hypothetical protein